MKYSKQQKNDLLFSLRFAVKGWSFMAEKGWPAKLAHAREIAKELPPGLEAEIAEILEPLRKRVER